MPETRRNVVARGRGQSFGLEQRAGAGSRDRPMMKYPVGLFLCALLVTGCSGGGSRSIPSDAPRAARPDGFKIPAALSRPVPPPPPATAPRMPSAKGRSTASTGAHPAFFAGEAALGNGVYYLALPNGNPFGYYSYLPDANYIYHFDFGYEYLADANDGQGGIYLYDFASSHWWYTGRNYPFPYVYDFTLSAVLYAFPDANNAGHYTANPRFFYDFGISQIIASTALDPTLQNDQPIAPAGGYSGTIRLRASNSVPSGTTIDALTSVAAPLALPTFAPYANSTVTPAALAFVTLTPSQTFALSSDSGFTITVPNGAAAGPGYLLELATANTAQKPVTWHVAAYEAYSAGGNVYQFYGNQSAVALGAGMPYVYAFLSVPQVVVTPGHLAIVGLGNTGTLTASEPQYGGSFNAVSSDTSIATVTPNGGGTFTVKAVAVGTVQITVSDSRGLATTVTVSVTTITLGVS